MAGEIVVLETGKRVSALFLYPIPTPKQVGGNNIVPTPSAGLPEIARLALTVSEIAALDGGTLAFEVARSFDMADRRNAAIRTELQARYARAKTAAAADYSKRYAFSGLRLDAV